MHSLAIMSYDPNFNFVDNLAWENVETVKRMEQFLHKCITLNTYTLNTRNKLQKLRKR